MSRATRAIYRLLGVVELVVDAVDAVKGLFKPKRPGPNDTDPIPLEQRRKLQAKGPQSPKR